MGAVRPAPAGDRGTVPDRQGECARVAERANAAATRLSLPDTVRPDHAGAAYRIRGIDLGVGGKITDKWSVFGGLVLMESEVTKSLVPSPQPLLYPTNVGLPLANIAHQSFSLLTKYQLTDVWEIGGQAVYALEDLRRHVPGREPGHVASRPTGASMPSRKPRSTQNWTREAVRQQHLRQALLRRALSERDAVRVRGAGPHRLAGACRRGTDGGQIADAC